MFNRTSIYTHTLRITLMRATGLGRTTTRRQYCLCTYSHSRATLSPQKVPTHTTRPRLGAHLAKRGEQRTARRGHTNQAPLKRIQRATKDHALSRITRTHTRAHKGATRGCGTSTCLAGWQPAYEFSPRVTVSVLGQHALRDRAAQVGAAGNAIGSAPPEPRAPALCPR